MSSNRSFSKARTIEDIEGEDAFLINHELTPDFLLESLAPFINSIGNLQLSIDKMLMMPPSNIYVRSLMSTPKPRKRVKASQILDSRFNIELEETLHVTITTSDDPNDIAAFDVIEDKEEKKENKGAKND